MRKEEIATPKVLFEDDFLLAIDKPDGLVINDSESQQDGSLQSWISQNLNFPISKDENLRSGIVHRLDKPTSGIVLVAKTEDIFYKLQKEFFERSVSKQYVALVHGKVKDQKMEINAPIGRLPKNRMRFGVINSGRDAQTMVVVDSTYVKRENPHDYYSLLNLYPKTGRTHQLRVHLKHIGHPVVSDHIYAGRKTFKKDIVWCNRLFLHAQSISFVHPATKKELVLESSLPYNLSEALLALQKI